MGTPFDLLPSAQSESNLSRGMFSMEGVNFQRFCSAAFFDVRQAFWHQVLLYKIKRSLPTLYYLVLKAYLENRRFYVRYNHQ